MRQRGSADPEWPFRRLSLIEDSQTS